jgi:tetratricopeptide (TPR) repeat protein
VNQVSWQLVKEIFAEASEKPEAEREPFVHHAAGSDAAVEGEVLRLLRLDDGAEERLAEVKPRGGMLHSAAEQHVFYSGEVLAGRYEILGFLASGGMGEVYEAEDLELGHPVAVKAIRNDVASPDHVFWLKREVHSARRIEHPNVCRVFDLVETQSASGSPIIFLTMELLAGETLAEKLRREGAMGERQALPLLRQMVAALAAAHRAGVIHRDFKSGNVMIVPRAGGPPRVVITDFGLARQAPPDSRATASTWSPATMASFGTPAYMAPEQIQGSHVGPAADIYALGVVLYEMLTGELPYPEDSPLAMAVKKTRERPVAPETLAPALRPTWSAAMYRCLEADPKKRFADVREILTHLETRNPRRLWWKLLGRQHGGKLKLAGAAACLAAAVAIAVWLWPAEPRAEAVADWQEGVYNLQAGEPVEAARRLERALAQRRLPAVAHAYLALAWNEAGFADKARAELHRALYQPLQPGPDRLFAQAVQLQLAGQGEAARVLLARRATATPGPPEALADLALLEDQLGRPGATPHWKQVTVKSPEHPAAHFRLAMAYVKENRWKEAEREFLLAQTYFGAAGDAGMVRAVSARRGFAHMQHGDVEEARNDLPSLLGFVPRPPGSGYAPCERSVTIMAGEADNFALPFDPIPYVNPDFAKGSTWPGLGRLKQFDEPRDDQILFASFKLPPLHFCGGYAEVHIRKGTTGYQNDTLSYGAVGAVPRIWSATVLLWADLPDAHERLLTFEIKPEFLLDVQRAQIGKQITSLDFTIGDDTTVDYIKLTLVY